jgi:hypothetical protein
LGTDPTERAKQWLGFVLLVGLTGIVLVAVAVELLLRHGDDPGVWSGCLVLISIILIGPVGIRIVSKRSDQSDNGSSGV